MYEIFTSIVHKFNLYIACEKCDNSGTNYIFSTNIFVCGGKKSGELRDSNNCSHI